MERRVGNRPEGIVKLSSRVWLLLAVLSGLPQASVAGQPSPHWAVSDGPRGVPH